MNSFYLACTALVVLSALFYLLPRGRAGAEQDLAQANLEWYRKREAELADEDEALQEDAQLRLLEDETGTTDQSVGAPRSFPAWVLFPIVAIGSAVMYYYLGSYSDVLIAQRLSSMGENTSPQQMESLIREVESRSERRPDNMHYSSLLGRYYMAQEDYASASDIYTGMLHEFPEDPQVLAFAAQSQYLAAGRQLSDKARLLAEQSLAANPHQRTALGLLGMASYEQGQYRAAISYWERLLVMEAPGSEGATMISGVISQARAQLGEDDTLAQVDPGPGSDVVDGMPGVTVRVNLPAGAVIDPATTVFVLARNAQGDSRMPAAVQRLSAAQLPLTLRLDDRSSMAGQKMSEIPSVIVAVQVSPSGNPGEATASYLGSAGPLSPDTEGVPVDITLQPTALASQQSGQATTAQGKGVTVEVLLPEGAIPDPRSTVYVLARNAASGGRMPVAVKRLSASQLPLTLRLDDSLAMAGQAISAVPSVIVAVQVSPSGQPGEAAATFLGEAGPIAPSLDTSPVRIKLRAR